MKKWFVLVTLSTLVLVFVFLTNTNTTEALAAGFPVRKATSTDLERVVVTIGVVKPEVGAEVKVGSRISGVVDRLYVGVGEEIAQGETLAQLDDAEWRTTLERAEAEIALKTTQLEYSKKRLSKSKHLQKNNFISEDALDERQRDYDLAKASLVLAKAERKHRAIQLGFTKIVAPISGTIASVSTYEGETVAANFAAPTFVTIVDLNRLEVRAYVDESDIGNVKVGRPVSFAVDAYPDSTFHGDVKAIYPKAELINNVVTYVVLISISHPKDIQLRPEMTAQVRFVLETRRQVVAVPRKAIFRSGGKQYVIVKTDKQWVKREVTSGLKTISMVEISSGLTVGERYVGDRQAWIQQNSDDLNKTWENDTSWKKTNQWIPTL